MRGALHCVARHPSVTLTDAIRRVMRRADHGVGSRTTGRQPELSRLRQGRRTARSASASPSARCSSIALGTYIPLPGIDPDAFAQAFKPAEPAASLGMFNMFAGGAVERMAIFALGIMPYISASIIVQLMTSVVAALEELKKEGEQGRKIINQYTRYVTVLSGAGAGLRHRRRPRRRQAASSSIRAGSSASRRSSR